MSTDQSTVSDGKIDVSDTVKEVVAESKEAVAYETHRKLLGQRKKDQETLQHLQAKLEKYEVQEREREEATAIEKGEFDKALKFYKEENEKLRGELGSINKGLVDSRKLSAFIDRLPGKIKRQEYLDYVDVDSIVLDPETGTVDDQSLEVAVSRFVKEHEGLYEAGEKRRLPSTGRVGDLSYKASGDWREAKTTDEMIKKFIANYKE